MTGLFGRLMVVAEAYPELQADDNFRQLQSQLSNIESELQSARRYYNATARDLNTKVVSFPDLVFAGPLGFKEEPYYEDADARSKARPRSISSGLAAKRILRFALARSLLPRAAAAEERIASFDSHIAIQKDGTLDVTETIRIRVENIRHQPRHLSRLSDPIQSAGRAPGPIGFGLIGTTLDGQPEPNAGRNAQQRRPDQVGSADAPSR